VINKQVSRLIRMFKWAVGNQHTGGKVSSCNLADLGVTKTQSHRWQTEAALPRFLAVGVFAPNRWCRFFPVPILYVPLKPEK